MSIFSNHIFIKNAGIGRRNPNIARKSVLLLGLFLLLSVLPGIARAEAAVPEPGPKFYVLDQAGVISEETENRIMATSRELASLTKAQVAVVTLKSLDGQPVEEAALGILRGWKLGDKELNNGLLILVVTGDRKMRIEVGYGLEGCLPDAKTGRIRDEYMLPAFTKADYDRGIYQGYSVIVQEIAKEYNVTLSRSDQVNANQPAGTGNNLPAWQVILGIVILAVLIWLDSRYLNGFIFGFILGMLFRGGRGGGGGFGGGDSGGGGSGGGGGSSGSW